jgi:putative ABC transport system permease protein
MQTFLIEATFVSIIGGIVGIGAGIAGAKVIGRLIDIPPIFLVKHITMTLVVSAVLGITFGIIPAKRAAEMDTVQALRS